MIVQQVKDLNLGNIVSAKNLNGTMDMYLIALLAK